MFTQPSRQASPAKMGSLFDDEPLPKAAKAEPAEHGIVIRLNHGKVYTQWLYYSDYMIYIFISLYIYIFISIYIYIYNDIIPYYIILIDDIIWKHGETFWMHLLKHVLAGFTKNRLSPRIEGTNWTWKTKSLLLETHGFPFQKGNLIPTWWCFLKKISSLCSTHCFSISQAPTAKTAPATKVREFISWKMGGFYWGNHLDELEWQCVHYIFIPSWRLL